MFNYYNEVAIIALPFGSVDVQILIFPAIQKMKKSHAVSRKANYCPHIWSSFWLDSE